MQRARRCTCATAGEGREEEVPRKTRISNYLRLSALFGELVSAATARAISCSYAVPVVCLLVLQASFIHLRLAFSSRETTKKSSPLTISYRKVRLSLAQHIMHLNHALS
jgi:hypothetical protein